MVSEKLFSVEMIIVASDCSCRSRTSSQSSRPLLLLLLLLVPMTSFLNRICARLPALHCLPRSLTPEWLPSPLPPTSSFLPALPPAIRPTVATLPPHSSHPAHCQLLCPSSARWYCRCSTDRLSALVDLYHLPNHFLCAQQYHQNAHYVVFEPAA